MKESFSSAPLTVPSRTFAFKHLSVFGKTINLFNFTGVLGNTLRICDCKSSAARKINYFGKQHQVLCFSFVITYCKWYNSNS